MASTPGGDPARPLATLAVQEGPRVGTEFPVQQPVVSIGRGGQSDLVIDDDSISTVHARLEYEHGGWRLTDLGSTNGTVVEGVRLAPHVPTPLPYGSSLRFGGVRLHFRPAEGANPEQARAEYAPPPPPRERVAERSGFRVPVWLALVLLLLVGLAIFLFGWIWPEPGAEPAAVEGVVEGASLLLSPGPTRA